MKLFKCLGKLRIKVKWHSSVAIFYYKKCPIYIEPNEWAHCNAWRIRPCMQTRAESPNFLEIGFGPPTVESKNCKNDVNFDLCDLFLGLQLISLWSSFDHGRHGLWFPKPGLRARPINWWNWGATGWGLSPRKYHFLTAFLMGHYEDGS